MENPFEIILEKLNNVEKTIEKLSLSSLNDSNTLLSVDETCELLKIKRTSLWKHTRTGRLTSYGFGNRVYYKKEEVLKSLLKL
ncbi:MULTISPECIES: helix-turn-helix domain-containing protein [Flavobacterium]|uniref:Helix-turn-helix domain-containing protein n=1 Tax=Flavobacterium algoritolerans TaxID=3041254 RepID=A0ABT6VAT6_9FLAO|nr:helix-turn-helix domain-containing protein [Flavobacterium algoritolerans]MDI5895356.1 helix-turn-helix domain-containing protein [Flavobacterium algoritolerans]